MATTDAKKVTWAGTMSSWTVRPSRPSSRSSGALLLLGLALLLQGVGGIAGTTSVLAPHASVRGADSSTSSGSSPGSLLGASHGDGAAPRAAPTITSVSPITTFLAEAIYINGTNLGSSPTTVACPVDTGVDTVQSASTPSLSLFDHTQGWNSFQSNGTGTNYICTSSITSWTTGQIILSGFTGNLGPGTPCAATHCIVVGDWLTLIIFAPSGQTVWWNLTVAASRMTYPAPAISSVSPISTYLPELLYVNGTNLGSAPTTVACPVDTGVDTVEAPGTPSIGIYDHTNAWSADLSNTTGSTNYICTSSIVSWTATQIVLSGFVGNLGTGVSCGETHCMVVGDDLTMILWGPGGQTSWWNLTVVAGRSAPPPAPAITGVSTISTYLPEQIYVNGTGLGSAPETIACPVGTGVDTVTAPGSPSLGITDHTSAWSGLLSNASAGTNYICTSDIVSWTSTQVILAGFVGHLGTGSGSGCSAAHCIYAGDRLTLILWGPGGQTAWWNITVTGPSSLPSPSIQEVSPVSTFLGESLYINGTNLGTSPLTVACSGGGVDTVQATGTPSLELYDHTAGWSAFHSNSTGATNAVCAASISAWTSTQVVLNGFAGTLGAGASCSQPHCLVGGDHLTLILWGPGGQTVWWNLTVTEPASSTTTPPGSSDPLFANGTLTTLGWLLIVVIVVVAVLAIVLVARRRKASPPGAVMGYPEYSDPNAPQGFAPAPDPSTGSPYAPYPPAYDAPPDPYGQPPPYDSVPPGPPR